MKRGLGKGLDALFADNSEEASSDGVVTLRISEIEPNKTQPRKKFDEEALSQLSDSIRQHGVLQPLVVRPIPGGGNYQLVAGERRWRAARMAGLTEIPVVIRELSDSEAMQIALIENLQREDLNAVEEAEGYQTLIEKYGLTQEEVSRRVGKSRPAVTNALRLLNLPQNVLNMVKSGTLTQGHARTLLSMEDPQRMEETAKIISSKGLSVREVEKMVRKDSAPPETANAREKKKNMIAGEIERGLSEYLGRKVKISIGKNSGTLEIQFYGEEDLKQLSMMISHNE